MILVAIGANLPGPDGTPPLETCRRAVAELAGLGAGLPGLQLDAVSRWYLTAPVPTSDQPDYVNAVALLSVAAPHLPPDPADLLAALQAIETRAGRRRGERNAARTLDLDVIAIGDTLRDGPDPVLPHPRAHERAFVLQPLAEVAPHWVHPRLGRSVAELIASLSPQQIRVL
jgi:2-amino-4-hydroxy-6-hydroxymethyldihydropteridine diphosphokinase